MTASSAKAMPGIPQTEADFGGVVVQRQVGAMYHEIEHPVGEDRQGDHQRRLLSRAGPGQPAVDEQRAHRPQDRPQETVRVRHVVQIQRIGSRDAGNDPDLFDAEQDERRPEDVQQLHRNEEDPEGNRSVDSLQSEGRAIVSDEHGGESR
jgi:hypothetical protein